MNHSSTAPPQRIFFVVKVDKWSLRVLAKEYLSGKNLSTQCVESQRVAEKIFGGAFDFDETPCYDMNTAPRQASSHFVPYMLWYGSKYNKCGQNQHR